MKNQENELNVLLPETSVKVNGEEIEVSPFPFKKLTLVVNSFSKIGVAFYSVAQSISIDKENNTVNITGDTIAAAANLFEQHFEDVATLMAIYCRKDRAFFMSDDFTINDGIKIMLMIIAMHKSFFTQTVSPAIKEMMGLPGQK